jgi:hypothetical protein
MMDCKSPTLVHAKAPVPYTTPRVIDFGALRDLTLIGCGPDHDGGIFGIADGRIRECFRSS